MGTSPLHPASDSRPPGERTGIGHGNRALGPSDSSDSGSDLVGAPDMSESDLDSDTDRFGTGEAASASPDLDSAEGRDIDADQVKPMPKAPREDGEEPAGP